MTPTQRNTLQAETRARAAQIRAVADFARRLTANAEWLDSGAAMRLSHADRWCEFTLRNKRIWDEAERAGVHYDVARVLVPLVK